MNNTTYNVIATRSGRWWAIEVTSGLPDDVLGVSQARRLTEVEKVARELIVDLAGGDPDDVEVVVETSLSEDLEPVLGLFREATSIETVARSVAAHARSLAADLLLDADLTVREAAMLLGVSHQRVKQLADRAHESDYDPNAVIRSMAHMVRALSEVGDEDDEVIYSNVEKDGVVVADMGHYDHDEAYPLVRALVTHPGSMTPISEEESTETEEDRVTDSSSPH